MNEAEEVVLVPTIRVPPVVEQPCEQAFDLPAPYGAAQRPPALRPGPAAMRSDQLDPAFYPRKGGPCPFRKLDRLANILFFAGWFNVLSMLPSALSTLLAALRCLLWHRAAGSCKWRDRGGDSDLPDRAALRGRCIPTLILVWRSDSVHPVSTARLAELLPSAELHVAGTLDEVRAWSGRIATFARAAALEAHP
ncbi:MAG TPA: hypothetical protein VKM54_08910 [Myxococcota bacterium]|nr:hypothetical protein [Myxococcota bacterium]